jgi:hypothetical protein
VIARVKFIARCARRGAKAAISYWGAVLGLVGLATIAGLSVPDHVAKSVPIWIKATVLVLIIVLLLVEGAYLEIKDAEQAPLPPPTAQSVTFIGGYHIHNLSNSAASAGPPPLTRDGAAEDDATRE